MLLSICIKYKLISQITKIDQIEILFVFIPIVDNQLTISNMNRLTQKKTLCDITMFTQQVFQEMNYEQSRGQSVSQFDRVFAKTLICQL